MVRVDVVSAERAHVIGLTGGIASGKSTVARALRGRGAIVIDADALAREVVRPGEPALTELVARFGDGILDERGELDRKRLGELVFADPAARTDLGRITHPRIAARSQAEIAAAAARGARVVFYEAALLVENQTHRALDALIVVATAPETQVARLRARDQLDERAARARVSAQLPLADKVAVATWVIHNDGEPAAMRAELDALIPVIEARFGPIAATATAAAPAAATAAAAAATTTAHVAAGATLVTGFPAYTARRMIRHLLAHEPAARLFILVRHKFAADAAQFLAALGDDRTRCEIVEGDVCDIDLGLATGEYGALRREVSAVFHLAGVYFTGVDDRTARRINVAGTRGVLEFAADCPRIQRLLHWSTAQVSGKRRGEILEEELVHRQGFHNSYERTKWEAEKLVRAAMRRSPITVVRPGVIVGDSRTGEIDRLDGPYYLMVLIATNASGLRFPLPGRGAAPMQLVPIDYVITAAHALARDPRAVGRTVHLVDPAPLPAREVLELVAAHARTEPPRSFMPGALTRLLLRTPGVERLARSQLAFLDSFDLPVHYSTRGADELLVPRGIVCPRLASYVGTLVQHVLDTRGHGDSGAPTGAVAADDVVDDVSDSLD